MLMYVESFNTSTFNLFHVHLFRTVMLLAYTCHVKFESKDKFYLL